MKRPPWAAFLKNKGIDALSHKQLQGACKKARLNAGGAAAALRARLQEFVELESPPAWYVESIKAAESKKKAQAESRKLAQEADVSVHDLLEWKENEMAVGQKLVHISVERLTGGSSVRLLTAQPKGCVKQSTTQLSTFSRSGFATAGGKKVCFRVLHPGEAVFLYEEHDGNGRSLKERIRVTLREPRQPDSGQENAPKPKQRRPERKR